MKKFFALILALAMALCLVACGQEEAAAPADDGADAAETEIVVVLKCVTSEYWNTVQDGCEQAGKDLGVKVTVVGPNAESEIEQQVAMIEQQIGAGCDAIVCAPNDAGAAAAALKAAIDAGIPVLAVDTNVGVDGQTCFVGTMNDKAAYQGAEWAIGYVGGEDLTAAIVYGQDGDNTSNLRMEGYQNACIDSKKVTIPEGAVVTGKNTAEGGYQVTNENLIPNFGEELDLVFCHNDDTAMGVAKALHEAGYDDVLVVGFDGNASAIKNIKGGEGTYPAFRATVAQQPYAMGYTVVENALKAIKGESVDTVVAADVAIINPDNVSNY